MCNVLSGVETNKNSNFNLLVSFSVLVRLLLKEISLYFKIAAMHRTPYQTLLAERMQSAKGLGWDFKKNGVGEPSAVWAAFALSSVFRWLRFDK